MSTALQLLGVPKVDYGGVVKPLRLSNPNLSLVYLAFRNDWISRSELAFLFRPDEDELTARKHVRLLLHRAKNNAWAEGLEANKEQLRFLVTTDVAAFKAAIEAKDWQQAIALYAGPLLGDFSTTDASAFMAWLELERTELQMSFQLALAEQAKLLEGNNDFEGASQLWWDLLKLDKLAEEVFQAYLRTTYLAGKRDKALKAYEDFCADLLAEFEIEPLDETQTLAQAIRESKPLKATARVEQAKIITNLPTPSTRFVGRKRALNELNQQLANPDCRLLTLIGLGGVGKTRLGLELARLKQSEFSDGVVYLELAPLASEDAFVTALAQTLSLSLNPKQSPKEQITNFLRDKVVLLVLDNAEHLLEITPFLAEVLKQAAQLKLLVTSRERLAVQGEWLYDIRGLNFPSEESENIEGYAAVKLFMNGAKRTAPQLEFSEADVQAIAQITRQVEGLPLALELASSWARIMPIERIAKELEQGYEFLETNLSDVPERHRNIRGILEATWQGLSEKKRTILTKFAVFRGGATLEAAEAITGAHFSILLYLVNESLLRRSNNRFDMHELVRQFAQAQLSTEEARAVAVNHEKFFNAFLSKRQHSLRTHNPPETIAEVGLETANIEAAWQHGMQLSNTATFETLSHNVFTVYFSFDWYHQGQLSFQHALRQLEANEVKAPNLKALALLYQAYFVLRLGRLEQSISDLKNVLDTFKDSQEHDVLGFVYDCLGLSYYLQGHYEEALSYHQKSLEAYQMSRNAWGMARCYNRLGVALDSTAHYHEAEETHKKSLAICRENGDLHGEASALMNVGILAETLGRYEEAQENYEDCHTLYKAIYYKKGIAQALTNLGHLAERQERYQEARAYYEKATLVKRELGDPVSIATTITNLADTLVALNELESAENIMQEALALVHQAKAYPIMMRVFWSYSHYFAKLGKYDIALAIAQIMKEHKEAEVWTRDYGVKNVDRWSAKLPKETVTRILESLQKTPLDRIVEALLQKDYGTDFHLLHT